MTDMILLLCTLQLLSVICWPIFNLYFCENMIKAFLPKISGSINVSMRETAWDYLFILSPFFHVTTQMQIWAERYCSYMANFVVISAINVNTNWFDIRDNYVTFFFSYSEWKRICQSRNRFYFYSSQWIVCQSYVSLHLYLLNSHFC